MFFPGFFGPGIIIDKNINGLVMHFQGGKLYTVTITGQQEYEFETILNGQNPSVHNC